MLKLEVYVLVVNYLCYQGSAEICSRKVLKNVHKK